MCISVWGTSRISVLGAYGIRFSSSGGTVNMMEVVTEGSNIVRMLQVDGEIPGSAY
jgi:hypothetical protein